MYGLHSLGFAGQRIVAALYIAFALSMLADNSVAGMLVVEGKRSHYVANQEEGTVYIVYGDGEWIRFADGFGHISGLCSGPDRSLYVLSGSQRKLYRVAADGKVRQVRKVGSCPQAIFVDRDGEVKFVQRNGLVTGVP
ncbi:MAG TPA: hypothetical protein DCS48_08045 [Desulfovibrio sp.]|nr:hypothetical protein [Desulfovibrio sp.]